MLAFAVMNESGTDGTGGFERDPALVFAAQSTGLYDYCLSLLGAPDEAADAVRDALRIAGRTERDGRSDEAVRPWLFALVRSEAVRRRPDGPWRPPVHGLELSSDPAVRLQEGRARLAAARLSPFHRELLDLSLRHHLSEAEIGAVLDITGTAVKIHMAHAVGELLGAYAELAGLPDSTSEVGAVTQYKALSLADPGFAGHGAAFGATAGPLSPAAFPPEPEYPPGWAPDGPDSPWTAPADDPAPWAATPPDALDSPWTAPPVDPPPVATPAGGTLPWDEALPSGWATPTAAAYDPYDAAPSYDAAPAAGATPSTASTPVYASSPTHQPTAAGSTRDRVAQYAAYRRPSGTRRRPSLPPNHQHRWLAGAAVLLLLIALAGVIALPRLSPSSSALTLPESAAPTFEVDTGPPLVEESPSAPAVAPTSPSARPSPTRSVRPLRQSVGPPTTRPRPPRPAPQPGRITISSSLTDTSSGCPTWTATIFITVTGGTPSSVVGRWSFAGGGGERGATSDGGGRYHVNISGLPYGQAVSFNARATVRGLTVSSSSASVSRSSPC